MGTETQHITLESLLSFKHWEQASSGGEGVAVCQTTLDSPDFTTYEQYDLQIVSLIPHYLNLFICKMWIITVPTSWVKLQ